MLGEKLGEARGQQTALKVLPSEGGQPKTEVSFRSRGTLLGIEGTDLGTYQAVVRPDGSLMGSGQGILMMQDGETATWTGYGVGRFTGRGAGVSWRGSLFYQTKSAKLARLNGIVGVFEFEVDDDGAIQATVWEWK